MPAATIGNQQVFSGNFGEAFLNGVKMFGFKGWTVAASASVQPEGQIGTGTPILVPGLISVTVTVSKLMMYDQSIAGIGVRPTTTLNDLWKIPPFTANLYDDIAGTLLMAAIGCMFDSTSLNAQANGAYLETVTFMGTDIQGTGGMTNG